ncbi:MAG: hypothetical protein Q8R55_06535 [Candidatus Taylorbacteria bacterium]|nr:hypothetical protein [Candidatus Taylorbacteria bacterium]
MDNPKKLFTLLLIILITIDVLGIGSYLVLAKGGILAPLKALILAQDTGTGPTGPIPYAGPYRQDCGGKSSGEAQALSLPAKLEYCSHPVGELRWFLANAGGFKYLVAVRTVQNGSNAYYSLTVREDASSIDPANNPNNLFIKLEPRADCICSDYNYDLYVYDGNNPSKLIKSSTRSGVSIEELEVPLVNPSGSVQPTPSPTPLSPPPPPPPPLLPATLSSTCDASTKTTLDAVGGCSETNKNRYPNLYKGCCTTAAASVTPNPTTTTATCDETAKAIVQVSGGCSEIDSTLYKNVYDACCSTSVTKASLLQILNNALADGVLSKTEKSSLLGALNSYLSATPTLPSPAPTPTPRVSTQTTGGGDTATESFRASCDQIVATDSDITAKCQRIDSSWVSAYYRRVGCSTDIANMDGVLLCASASGGSGGGSTCTSNQGTLSLSMNSGSYVVVGGYRLSSTGRYSFDGGYTYSCYGYGPTDQYHDCSRVTIRSCQTTNVLINWSQ